MTLPNRGAHTDGGSITEGQDTKEDTSNKLDNLIENSQNKSVDFDVTAGGTFNFNTPQANLDIYLENGLIRLIGSPGAATTIIVPDGNIRVAFENASTQSVTINTVTGAAAPIALPTSSVKTIHVRGAEFTTVADDATQTGALLADGSVNASGDFNWADFQLKRALLIDYAEGYVTLVPAASVTADMELGNFFDLTLDQVTTLVFDNPPASGRAGSFTLIVRQDVTGGRLITWPGSVNWEGAAAPTLSTGANQIDMLSFITINGGTTWFGFLGGKNFG